MTESHDLWTILYRTPESPTLCAAAFRAVDGDDAESRFRSLSATGEIVFTGLGDEHDVRREHDRHAGDQPTMNTLEYITLAEYCRLAGLDEYTTQCALTDDGTVSWGGTITVTLVHADVIATVLGHELPANVKPMALVLLP